MAGPRDGGKGIGGDRHGDHRRRGRPLEHTRGGASGKRARRGQGRKGGGALLALLLTATAPAQAAALSPPAPSPAPPTPFASGPRLPLSLAEAVFLGLRDNRSIRSAYIERIAQKYDLFVARTRFWPTATINAEAVATRDNHVSGSELSFDPTASWLLPTGAQFQFAFSKLRVRGGGQGLDVDIASLSLTQPLLKGAGLAVNLAPIRIAELQERINQLSLRSTVADTVTEIIVDYRALLGAQTQVGIAKDALARARDQLSTNRALVDAGRMAAADLVQSEADIAEQQVELIAAEQQLNSAQIALARLLAIDLHTDIIAADPLSADHVDIDLDHAIAVALANRPDYLSQARTLEEARETLRVAKNNRLWTLNLVGSVQRQTGGGPLAINPATGLPIAGSGFAGTSSSVGLQLSIPLGDHSLEQAVVQAQTDERVDEIALDDERQQVEAQVRDAVQGVEMGWRRLVQARQARDLAARTVELERDKLAAGRASNFELLSFESDLRAADRQALAAAIDYLDALTTLDQQLGTTLETWKITLNP